MIPKAVRVSTVPSSFDFNLDMAGRGCGRLRQPRAADAEPSYDIYPRRAWMDSVTSVPLISIQILSGLRPASYGFTSIPLNPSVSKNQSRCDVVHSRTP